MNPYAVAGGTGGPRSASMAVGAAVVGAAGLVVLGGGVASAEEGDGTGVDFSLGAESAYAGVEDGGALVDPGRFDIGDDAAAETWSALDAGPEVDAAVSLDVPKSIGAGTAGLDAQLGDEDKQVALDESPVGSDVPVDGGVVTPLSADAWTGASSPVDDPVGGWSDLAGVAKDLPRVPDSDEPAVGTSAPSAAVPSAAVPSAAVPSAAVRSASVPSASVPSGGDAVDESTAEPAVVVAVAPAGAEPYGAPDLPSSVATSGQAVEEDLLASPGTWEAPSKAEDAEVQPDAAAPPAPADADRLRIDDGEGVLVAVDPGSASDTPMDLGLRGNARQARPLGGRPADPESIVDPAQRGIINFAQGPGAEFLGLVLNGKYQSTADVGEAVRDFVTAYSNYLECGAPVSCVTATSADGVTTIVPGSAAVGVGTDQRRVDPLGSFDPVNVPEGTAGLGLVTIKPPNFGASGNYAQNLPGVERSDLTSARQLSRLFPDMPVTGTTVAGLSGDTVEFDHPLSAWPEPGEYRVSNPWGIPVADQFSILNNLHSSTYPLISLTPGTTAAPPGTALGLYNSLLDPTADAAGYADQRAADSDLALFDLARLGPTASEEEIQQALQAVMYRIPVRQVDSTPLGMPLPDPWDAEAPVITPLGRPSPIPRQRSMPLLPGTEIRGLLPPGANGGDGEPIARSDSLTSALEPTIGRGTPAQHDDLDPGDADLRTASGATSEGAAGDSGVESGSGERDSAGLGSARGVFGPAEGHLPDFGANEGGTIYRPDAPDPEQERRLQALLRPLPQPRFELPNVWVFPPAGQSPVEDWQERWPTAPTDEEREAMQHTPPFPGAQPQAPREGETRAERLARLGVLTFSAGDARSPDGLRRPAPSPTAGRPVASAGGESRSPVPDTAVDPGPSPALVPQLVWDVLTGPVTMSRSADGSTYEAAGGVPFTSSSYVGVYDVNGALISTKRGSPPARVNTGLHLDPWTGVAVAAAAAAAAAPGLAGRLLAADGPPLFGGGSGVLGPMAGAGALGALVPPPLEGVWDRVGELGRQVQRTLTGSAPAVRGGGVGQLRVGDGTSAGAASANRYNREQLGRVTNFVGNRQPAPFVGGSAGASGGGAPGAQPVVEPAPRPPVEPTRLAPAVRQEAVEVDRGPVGSAIQHVQENVVRPVQDAFERGRAALGGALQSGWRWLTGGGR